MFEKEYILGLVDGEGSFTVYVHNPDVKSERKRRVLVEPRFYVKLIEKDKKVLYELKEFFDCGNVYFQKDVRKNQQNCYRYEVASRKDLREKIIPFFKMYSLKFPSKQKDFKIFCRLVDLIEKGNHRTVVGLRRIYTLKQEMH
jgi:hypothetical protein